MHLVLVACLLLLLPPMAGAQDGYSVERMKGNVYRFTAGNYRSLFMVTVEGLFVTDPISEKAATWLRSELEERFDVPIRFLAYSHNHVDHVLGGEALAGEGVTVIAHEYAAEDLQWTRVPTAMPDLTFRHRLDIELGGSRVEMRYHGPNNVSV